MEGVNQRRRCWQLVVALGMFACFVVATTASELSADLDEVNYVVDYVHLHEYDYYEDSPVEHGHPVLMTRHDGKRFQCILPDVAPASTHSSGSNAPLPTIASLLAPLKQNCLYRLEGWWTYEFCYGKSVLQFHQEGDNRVAIFVLGSADTVNELTEEEEAAHRQRIETEEGLREAYTELYTGGTVCDITGKPRTIQVEFYCSPSARAGMLLGLKEPSTCNYVISVATSLLCAHPEFRVEEKPNNSITCRELPPGVGDDDDSDLAELGLLPQEAKLDHRAAQGEHQQEDEQHIERAFPPPAADAQKEPQQQEVQQEHDHGHEQHAGDGQDHQHDHNEL